jgi:hypothetical protein
MSYGNRKNILAILTDCKTSWERPIAQINWRRGVFTPTQTKTSGITNIGTNKI